MTKIDIEKFICSIRRRFGENKYISTCLDSCLKDQGLRYIDKPEGGVLIRYMKEGKPIKVPKFRVGDKIRRKTPRRYDKDMQVTRIESNYYLCNHLGKFSSESISFSEESNYELVEQKPDDKVETKFHEGDWVILTAGELSTTLQIVKVDTNKKLYWFNDSSYLPIVDEECLHFWSIKDAKDGDVVADKSDGAIGIFQSIGHHPDGGSYNDPSYCFLHCHCDDEFFYADFENGNEIDSDDLVPATKEQRVLLFQKMHEAGYEWDAELKQLKKIEQKPAEWSERDKEEFQIAIDTLVEAGQHDSAHWLKSLKERVQYQPQWKPSNEQLVALRIAIGDEQGSGCCDILRSLLKDLKSL